MKRNSFRRFSAALTAAMFCVPVFSGCGTSESLSSEEVPYDVSSIAKDESIASVLPESIAESGKLKIGLEPGFAPAEFIGSDGKTIVGYEVDFANAIAAVLGVEAVFVPSSFDSIIPAIGTKFDIGFSGFTVTEERMESVDFVSYYRSGSIFVSKRDSLKNIDTDSLCGLKIGVQTGTTHEELVNDLSDECQASGQKKIDVISLKSMGEVSTAVVTGKADLLYSDLPVALYAVSKTSGQLQQVGQTSDTAKNAIAIKKGDSQTAQAMQKAMQKLMDDGTYGRILKKWSVNEGALSEAEINPEDIT